MANEGGGAWEGGRGKGEGGVGRGKGEGGRGKGEGKRGKGEGGRGKGEGGRGEGGEGERDIMIFQDNSLPINCQLRGAGIIRILRSLVLVAHINPMF